MFVDISKPPNPLPTPQLKTVSPDISLLQPLSRAGSGPGLIILASDLEDTLLIKNGVPSQLRKWAEEGYTVVEIQARVFDTADESILKKAIAALSQCDKCTSTEAAGLVAYSPELWNAVAPLLPTSKEIVAAVIYADSSTKESLASTTLPVLYHLAGKPSSPKKASKTPQMTEYEYPQLNSHLFATPFQETFNNAAEGVSHTRNLTFLKKRMGGPFFDLEAIWDEHTYFEFENRSVEHTMATMVDEPYVNHVPTMMGGIGRDDLAGFYAKNFIFQNPEDAEMELISRTIGIDRVVDEFIFKFTHTTEVDWMIPGIPPTGRRLEVPFTAIVTIRGDRLSHEHIAWDQGTVLSQLGLLPAYLPFPYPCKLPDGRDAPGDGDGKRFEYRVPVAGRVTAEKVREKGSVPSNEMVSFRLREV